MLIAVPHPAIKIAVFAPLLNQKSLAPLLSQVDGKIISLMSGAATTIKNGHHRKAK